MTNESGTAISGNEAMARLAVLSAFQHEGRKIY
jgi:hypothetical protein